MLIVCLILYNWLHRGGYAAHITAPGNALHEAVTPIARDTSGADLCPRQRLDIIWACIATILASSWVSVHPNLPHPEDSKAKKTLRRIELMFWAIISPELIIYWAMRQWYGARWMKKEFEKYRKDESSRSEIGFVAKIENDHVVHMPQSSNFTKDNFRWTKTHGFFLQMGGFILHEDGNAPRVLGWMDLFKYYREGRVDLSNIPEARINDHSKADGFAKGLALLQTCWFIIQCVARFSENGLILTELELVTAALAVLSLVMYLLWWNKPFNAEIPIIITLRPQPINLDDPKSKPRCYNYEKPLLMDLKDALYECRHIPRRIREFIHESGTTDDLADPFYTSTGVLSVPTFYSIGTPTHITNLQMRLPCFSIAAFFGAIHCVGWSHKIHFSSSIASLLWRISSAVTTGVPLIWTSYFLLDYAHIITRCNVVVNGSDSELTLRLHWILERTFRFTSILTVPFYIVSRIILLVLAFLELQNISPGALSTVEWANVLPFIH